MAAKEHIHADTAEKIVKALPAKLRDRAELKAGGGEYTIVKIDGKSVASVRDRNVRIVHPTDGGAEHVKHLASLIADAAPEPKPADEKPAKKPAKKSAGKKADAPTAEGGEGEAK
jgi:hypothetical protein